MYSPKPISIPYIYYMMCGDKKFGRALRLSNNNKIKKKIPSYEYFS